MNIRVATKVPIGLAIAGGKRVHRQGESEFFHSSMLELLLRWCQQGFNVVVWGLVFGVGKRQ